MIDYDELHELRGRLTNAIADCDQILDGLVRRPGMWGPPVALEFQFLNVCDLKLTLSGRFAGFIRDEWLYFVSQKLPGTSSVFPYAHDKCDQEALATLMQEFLDGPYADRLNGTSTIGG